MTDTPSNTKTGDKKYSVTELCREFGLTPRALRFYEERKLLMPLRVGTTRVFSHRDRVRLQLILRGKRFGFSLTEIREMLDLYNAPEGKVKQLQVVLPKLQSQLGILKKEREHLAEVIDELGTTCTELAGKVSQTEDAHSGDC